MNHPAWTPAVLRVADLPGPENHQRVSHEDGLRFLAKACDSVIEGSLVGALLEVAPSRGFGQLSVAREGDALMLISPLWFNGVRGGRPLGITTQAVYGPYRVDIHLQDEEHHDVVVECDGHDFHEKTRKQAARDKARDRYLVRQSARVLRFTGSEIHRDALACANESLTVLLQDDR